ncbi:MAG: type II CRISPR RNA-guided endonuclease Cas9 [Lachnospiraceae bacterium]|nr:type II CRISPR RNA-guided endonuclease Cas9 [Lachnospiraceae bacterium]
MGKYYLGLDMGTSTVGWAVTDEEYRLIRKKGKDLWGIREFEEAKTAVERRTQRVARRRRQREVARIGLLKNYFKDAVSEVDPNFFERMEQSKYYFEDKSEGLYASDATPDALFHDLDYHDKDYYREYPTIFHLRKELIENSEPHDVRLVYLALLNMFKHRGHFLNASLGLEDSGAGLHDAYNALCELLTTNELGMSLPAGADIEQLQEILSSRDYSRSKKQELIAQLFGLGKNQKKEVLLVKAICGLQVDAKALFGLEETEDKIGFSFSDFSYDEKEADLSSSVGEDNFQVIQALKAIYDIGSLSGILKGERYLSQARVNDYNKHAADLKLLKEVYKDCLSKKAYQAMFRSEDGSSYSAYVGSNLSDGTKKRRSYKDRKADDLYKKIKKDLKDVDDPRAKLILEEISKETFLPKQLTSANGVIPNQVHAREMKKILQNASNYLPFLAQIGESGQPIADEILALFTFQIPYYVGPLSSESERNGGNGWVVRKEEGVVMPWNLEQKVDLRKTSERFIENLIRKCTYLQDEKVLPKASLKYQRYCVLNEINNLRYDGDRLPVEWKKEIYHELFETRTKVTRKLIEEYLSNKIGNREFDAQKLTGIDRQVNNTLSSYVKLKAVFGDTIDTDTGREMAENIIFWCTVYGDSKKFLLEQLEHHYPHLTKEDIKKIISFRFKDWGNLSDAFLGMEGVDKATGEVCSLLKALWDNNLNMMELIHSEDFTFADTLAQRESRDLESLCEMKPEDLDEYYFSAPVKKMIWQTLQIIKEIEKVMGEAPAKVFIEMTRSDEEKGDLGRKDSRKKQLLDLYKAVKDESRDWADLIEKEDASGRLRSKKMYLYLRQMGRDLYTGKPIDLDDLFNDNLYDIDHIYPRHFVKDDNLENNLALVNKPDNANKTDNYPLDANIRQNPKVKELWESLHIAGLMNDEKYRRLTGSRPFTEEQQADFIARQLVETSQATKGVADVLKQVFPETTAVVYSKAGNVSEFRHDKHFYKSRLVNDFHHAHDAYLNIVVGNVYDVKFTRSPRSFIRKMVKENGEEYNLNRMFDFDVKRGETVAWIGPRKGNAGTIETVRKMMSKNTPLLTRQSFTGHGQISDATLKSAEDAKNGSGYIPLKSSDMRLRNMDRYGGFTKATTAYFFLVEHDGKKGRVRTLETVPLFLKAMVEKDPDYLIKYCSEILDLKNPDIRLNRIKIQSTLKLNDFYLYLSGRTGNQIFLRNAVQMKLHPSWVKYIKALENGTEKMRFAESVTKEKNFELYQVLKEKHVTGIYSKRPNPVGKKLVSGEHMFLELSLDRQVYVLLQILGLSNIGPTSADLTDIGGSGASGTMKISNTVNTWGEAYILNQSTTGVFEEKINLLTI